MSISLISTKRKVVWAESINLNYKLTVKKGDLILLYQMINSSNVTTVTNPFKKIGISSGFNLWYQIAAVDGDIPIVASGGTGAFHEMIFRSETGNIEFVHSGTDDYSSKSFNLSNSTDNLFAITTTGGSPANMFNNVDGWTIALPDTSWVNSPYYNAAYKSFNKTNVLIPAHPTWVKNDAFLIVKETNSVNIEVATSDDGILFSSYKAFDPASLPQKRYLKFKAKIGGGVTDGKTSTFEFDQSKPETKVDINDFLESVSVVKPKTVYKQDMVEDITYTDAKLFTASVDRTKYKKVTKLEVK